MKRAAILAAAIYLATAAHVGSKNVFFSGAAGPYDVSVVVRPPDVVPGLAEISVRVPDGRNDVERVTVRPVRWDAQEGGAPPPDPAVPVPGDSELYSAELWLMTVGAYRIEVTVDGARGSGTASVPVTSVMRGVRDLPPALGGLLVVLGGLLLSGAVAIAGAAVRESRLAADEGVRNTHRRRARFAMALASGTLLAAAYGGYAWWNTVDREARSGIFQRLSVEGVVTPAVGGPVLEVRVTDPSWLGRNWSPLVPDHGKLMHMFVIGAPDMRRFAHVHPVPVDSATFRAPWPDLPAGEYRIYGDIVHETGFAQTVVDTLFVLDEALTRAEPVAVGEGDPDDSSWRGAPVPLTDSNPSTPLADGSTLVWMGETELRVDEEVTLTFAVRDPVGDPAALEPYMGMLSHAALTRTDGSVFVHLHPAGTISMGSLSVLAPDARPPTQAGAVEEGMGDGTRDLMVAGSDDPAARVEFPYAFPQPGEYAVWVQVKREGQVLTGAFRVKVEE